MPQEEIEILGVRKARDPLKVTAVRKADADRSLAGTLKSAASDIGGGLGDVGSGIIRTLTGDTAAGGIQAAEGALQALGGVFRPVEAPLENIARTLAPALGSSTGTQRDRLGQIEAPSQGLEQTAENISKLVEAPFDITAQRPETGLGPAADLAADLTGVVAGGGAAFKAAKALRSRFTRNFRTQADEAAKASRETFPINPAKVEARAETQAASPVQQALSERYAALPQEASDAQLQRLLTQAENSGLDQDTMEMISTRINGGPVPKNSQQVRRMFKFVRRLKNVEPLDRPDAIREVLNPAKLPKDPSRMRQMIEGGSSTLVTSGLVSLGKQGPTGKVLMNVTEDMLTRSFRRAGNLVADYRQIVRGLSRAQKRQVRRVLDYGEDAPNERVAAAAQAIRGQLDSVAEEATARQVRVFDPKTGEYRNFQPLDNFLPHQIDLDKLGTVRGEETALAAFLKKHPDASLEEAQKWYAGFRKRLGTRKMGSLEHGRDVDLPEEFYETDLDTLMERYFVRAARRLEEVRAFAPDDSILHAIKARIADEGGNAKLVDQVMERVLGSDRNSDIQAFVSGLKGAMIVAKFSPLTTALNFTQTASTVMRTNLKASAIGIYRAARNPRMAREQAIRAGGALDAAIKEGHRIIGADGRITDEYLRLIGFNAAEQFNRTLASSIGRSYAEDQVRVLLAGGRVLRAGRARAKLGRAERRLEELGLDPGLIKRRGSVTEEELQTAAQKITFETQFGRSGADLPLWFTDPGWSILTQFKSFGVQQAKLIKNQVKRELAWKDGRITNLDRARQMAGLLGRAGLASNLLGGSLAAGRRALLGQEQQGLGELVFGADPQLDNVLVEMMTDSIMVGQMGILMDLLAQARWGGKSTALWMAGPSIGTAGDVTAMLGDPVLAAAHKAGAQDRVEEAFGLENGALPRGSLGAMKRFLKNNRGPVRIFDRFNPLLEKDR